MGLPTLRWFVLDLDPSLAPPTSLRLTHLLPCRYLATGLPKHTRAAHMHVSGINTNMSVWTPLGPMETCLVPQKLSRKRTDSVHSRHCRDCK